MDHKYSEGGMFPYADAFLLGRTNGTPNGDSYPGTSGDDIYNGLAGGDYIRGLGGDDLLRGGTGGDAIYGDGGKDKLFGGADGDLLSGGKGADIMTGDTGGDGFVFATGFGADVITDFDATTVVPTEHDHVDLSDVKSIKDFNDLVVNHLSRHGADLVIDDHHGDTLTLEDVRLKDIDSSDFTF